jgi:CheY-like chemotaxis protein
LAFHLLILIGTSARRSPSTHHDEHQEPFVAVTSPDTPPAAELTEGPEPAPAQREMLLERVRVVAHRIEARVRDSLPPVGPLRVLVVDDHPDAADTLAEILIILGCDVRVCYDGQSALAAFDAFAPDVCLLDLMMPGIDGLELARRLRDRFRTRPVFMVATTALGTLEDRTRTALAGFHYHLVKPIPVPELLSTLSRFRDLSTRPEPTR